MSPAGRLTTTVLRSPLVPPFFRFFVSEVETRLSSSRGPPPDRSTLRNGKLPGTISNGFLQVGARLPGLAPASSRHTHTIAARQTTRVSPPGCGTVNHAHLHVAGQLACRRLPACASAWASLLFSSGFFSFFFGFALGWPCRGGAAHVPGALEGRARGRHIVRGRERRGTRVAFAFDRMRRLSHTAADPGIVDIPRVSSSPGTSWDVRREEDVLPDPSLPSSTLEPACPEEISSRHPCPDVAPVDPSLRHS